MSSAAYIYPLLEPTVRVRYKRGQQSLTSENLFDEFIYFACEHFRIKHHDFISKKRFRNLVEARQWACYFYRQFCNDYKIYPLSLTHMGNKLGNKDHATVLHSIRAMATTLEWAFVSKKMELNHAYDVFLELNAPKNND
jgi:chromosomal replication initiation ATPase DnaA